MCGEEGGWRGGGRGEGGVVRIRRMESGSGTVVPEGAERERMESRREERPAAKRCTAGHGGACSQRSRGGPPTWRPLSPPERGGAGWVEQSPSLRLGRRGRGGAPADDPTHGYATGGRCGCPGGKGRHPPPWPSLQWGHDSGGWPPLRAAVPPHPPHPARLGVAYGTWQNGGLRGRAVGLPREGEGGQRVPANPALVPRAARPWVKRRPGECLLPQRQVRLQCSPTKGAHLVACMG